MTVPLGISILLNLYINIRYGRDAWFKRFPKNYDRFRHIFIVQRVYFFTWTLSMVPVILYSLVSNELYMPLHTWVMALQPSCMILCVIVSNILKKTLSSQQMTKEGFVQYLKESNSDETDSFKEIIRKEVVERIANAVDYVFKQKIQQERNFDFFDAVLDRRDSYEFEISSEYIPLDGSGNIQKNENLLQPKQAGKLVGKRQTIIQKTRRCLCCRFKCCCCCRKRQDMNIAKRGTVHNIYGDKDTMAKVDLYDKNEIVDEALEKECYEVVIDKSKQKYIFENYASRIYKNIRKIYDVREIDVSTCFGKSAIPDLDVKISTGKGGAFFLKNKYNMYFKITFSNYLILIYLCCKHSSMLIKSITPGEYEIFKQFTDKYYMYLLDNPKTLLTPIFGVFTLSLSANNDIPNIHFIVMKSVFDPSLVSPHQKMIQFDLKGSEQSRFVLKSDEYSLLSDMRTCPRHLIKETLKDIDFKNTFKTLSIDNSFMLKTQIDNDAKFLATNNFMDYSLLMFIVFDYGDKMEDPDEPEDLSTRNAKYSKTQERISDFNSLLPKENNISSFTQIFKDKNGYKYKRHIYFGIIDYLTSFGFFKMFEEKFKNAYSSNCSCVHPEKYEERFVKFVKNVIDAEK